MLCFLIDNVQYIVVVAGSVRKVKGKDLWVSKNFVPLLSIIKITHSCGIESQRIKVFQPSLKYLFSIEIEPQGYFHTSRKPFTRLKIFIMKQKGVFRVGLSLYFGFEAPKLVRVKAYERIRNGKVEKVRSHYRNVEGRLVIRNELHR